MSLPGRPKGESLSAQHEGSPASGHILLVDDDPATIRLLGHILAGTGHLHFATSGEDALRFANATPPDLILLDADMPGMSGFEVCEALKANPDLADVLVIFVSSHGEPKFEVSGFDLGAADYIVKPVNALLVLARVKTQLRLKSLADELRTIATIDAVTGIANRRLFDDALPREWRRARRSGDPIALLMIDIDHFKSFNDLYGHPAGDACLRSVAQALKVAGTRPADLVARYGGEEFVVLLPQTPRAGAAHVAHTMLDAIRGLGIEHRGSPTLGHLTVSVGIGCFDEHSASWARAAGDSRFGDALPDTAHAAGLLQSADAALYGAKRAGRAQAWLLDIADVGLPERARRLAPPDATTPGDVADPRMPA